MNKYTGVLGVYNCQGAAWCSIERKNAFLETKREDAITGFIRGRDVHLINEASTDPEWTGDCAIYCHRSGELIVLPYNASVPVSFKVLEHDIFTITPIKVLVSGLNFAPFGLVNMYNAGGAIEGLRYEAKEGNGVCMEVKGCGKFGAYSSAKPKKLTVNSRGVDFDYDFSSGLLSFNLVCLPEEGKFHNVDVEL